MERAAERIEGAGVELAVERRAGEEPAVVAAHGTDSDRSTWDPVAAALPGRAFVAYDRRGYGDSGAPEGYAGTTVEEQAEDLLALIAATCAQPPVLLGHSFGAIVCLDVLLRHPDAARAGVLIEPPLLALVPEGAEEMGKLREELEQLARKRERPVAALRAIAADFAAAPLWTLERRRLRALERRVVLLAGTASEPYRGRIAENLAPRLADAELRRVAGGHMLHRQSPADVAAAVTELLPEHPWI